MHPEASVADAGLRELVALAAPDEEAEKETTQSELLNRSLSIVDLLREHVRKQPHRVSARMHLGLQLQVGNVCSYYCAVDVMEEHL